MQHDLEHRQSLTPWAWLIGAAAFVFFLATARGYGIFRDELYYLACSEHLGLGYVDQPPLIAWITWAVRHTLGTSLLALRALPAAAAAATILTSAWIARELGGGRFAQSLTALCVAAAPIYLALFTILSMNAFDVLIWSLALAVLVRLLGSDRPHLWLAFGVLVGIGLENKLSVLFLGFGVVVGLLLTPARRHLRTPWPWLGGLIAAVLLAPHVLWQVSHGWPTLEFIRNATENKNLPVSPLDFLGSQVLGLNPAAALVWIAGLGALLAAAWARRWRAIGWAYLAILAVMVFQRGKPYYLSPVYPVLFAAGAVVLERASAERRRWLRPAVAVVVILVSAAVAPLAKPLLPEDALVAYARALGEGPSTDERHELGRLGQFFADMHGWRELALSVATVVDALPPADRARVCIFGQNYGEAGAIDHFGPTLGLPKAISGHNSYWLWGPRGCDGSVVVVIGGDRDGVERVFGSVEAAGVHHAEDVMPYENDLTIWLCREPRIPIEQLWPQVKHYG
jgi:hypothetical protein